MGLFYGKALGASVRPMTGKTSLTYLSYLEKLNCRSFAQNISKPF
jgi:hypothetical protein